MRIYVAYEFGFPLVLRVYFESVQVQNLPFIHIIYTKNCDHKYHSLIA